MKAYAGIGVAAIALVFTLGGCSRDGDHAQSAEAPASHWLAVGLGKVEVEGGMAEVTARTDGVVESVEVSQGDRVKTGQVLARLDSRAAEIEVAKSKAGVAEATAKLAELEVSLKLAEQREPLIAAAAKAGGATGLAAANAAAQVASLKAKQTASKAALEGSRKRLAVARLNLDTTAVRAPVTGTVIARHVVIGQAVSPAPGQSLFTLLPRRPHIVRAQVNAQAATKLHPGMHAEVISDSGSGLVYSATVVWVGNVLQAATLTRGALARALADDVICRLKLDPVKAGVTPLPIGQRVIVKFPRQ